MSEKILTWWNERFSTPPIFSMQVGSYEACKEMVINGLGYAIIPRNFIKPDDDLYVQELVLKKWRSALPKQLAAVSRILSGAAFL